MGRDKARVEVDGTPLIMSVARHLEQVFGRPPTVVSAPGRDYEDLGFVTIADEVPDGGPMSGIHRALLDSATARRGDL
jgi:molybdopterin-guanine dinucleotide biosynthesis protein A